MSLGCPLSWGIILVSPRPFSHLWDNSSSKMSDDSSSPIPNAAHSTLLRLATISRLFTLNVSWDESFTLMEEFTCMYSSISDGSFPVERLMYSMWEAATLTSRSVDVLHGRCMITQSKMAMFAPEDSSGQTRRAETAMGRLIIHGIRSSLQRLLKSFGHFVMTWLQEICVALFPHFKNTSTGDILLLLDPTVLTLGLSLTRHELQNCTSGCLRLVWDVENWD